MIKLKLYCNLFSDKLCYSVYFQDIVVPSYEYSPFHEINNNFNTLKYEIYGKEIINKNIGGKKWNSNKYKDFLKNI